MKKILIFSLFTLAIFMLVLPVMVLAQGRGAKNQQLQVTTQEEDSLPEDEEGETKTKGKDSSKTKSINSRSEMARQHMSIVASEVEKLLTTEDRQGGIGKQVREIARQQKQAQEETEEELDKLDLRKGFLKKLFGPNYKAIRNIKKQIEQNQLRIRQLDQLQTQVANQADKVKIQEAAQALVEQNTALQEQIEFEKQTPSLFGWLFKIFS